MQEQDNNQLNQAILDAIRNNLTKKDIEQIQKNHKYFSETDQILIHVLLTSLSALQKRDHVEIKNTKRLSEYLNNTALRFAVDNWQIDRAQAMRFLNNFTIFDEDETFVRASGLLQYLAIKMPNTKLSDFENVINAVKIVAEHRLIHLIDDLLNDGATKRALEIMMSKDHDLLNCFIRMSEGTLSKKTELIKNLTSDDCFNEK